MLDVSPSSAPPHPRQRLLTQEEDALAVVDHHDAILELGGQVEGEAGLRQVGLRRRDLLQHVAHDVITGRAVPQERR